MKHFSITTCNDCRFVCVHVHIITFVGTVHQVPANKIYCLKSSTFQLTTDTFGTGMRNITLI